MNHTQTPLSERFVRMYRILVFVFPVLALLTAAGYFLAMKNDFDTAIGHFASDSVPYMLVIITVLVSVLLAGAAALIGSRAASFNGDPDENPVSLFGAVFTALMSLASLFPVAGDLMLGVSVSKAAIAAAVLTPFIGVSMVLSIIPAYRFSSARRFCAVLAAVCVNISMFADYFDFTLPLNSPVRNLVTVAKGAVLLYLLSEARFSFGFASSRPTLLFTVFSSALTASASLGYTLGAILSNSVAGLSSIPNPPTLHLCLYTAIGIHAAGRLFSLIPVIGAYRKAEKTQK